MRWPADAAFWIGVNLPWLNYGGDFGANRWQPGGGVGQPDRRAALREALGRLAGQGVTRHPLVHARRRPRRPPGVRVRRRWSASTTSSSATPTPPSTNWIAPACGHLRPLRLPLVQASPHRRRRANRRPPCARGRSGPAPPPAGARGRRRCSSATAGTRRSCAWDVINEPEWVTRSARLPLRRPRCRRAAMRAFIRDVVGARPRPHVARRHGRQRVGADAVACRGSRPGCLPGPLVRPPREAGPARSAGRRARPRPPAHPRRVPDPRFAALARRDRRDRPPGRLRRRPRLVGAGRRRGVGRERAGGGALGLHGGHRA